MVDEDQSALEAPPSQEASGETRQSIEGGASASLSFEEEEMEPSTDNEQRLWRYPRVGDDVECGVTAGAPEERGGSEGEWSPGEGAPPAVQDGDDCHSAAEVSPLVDALKTEKDTKTVRPSDVHTSHGDIQACDEDCNEEGPMQTVDMVALSDSVKQEEEDLECKSPAGQSSMWYSR